MNKPITKFSKKAMDILNSYHWPGNVRELVNAIERSVVFCKGKILTEKELPANIKAHAKGQSVELDLTTFSLSDAEKSLIQKVLQKTNWNLKHSAELLQISRGTLYSKIDKHNIKR